MYHKIISLTLAFAMLFTVSANAMTTKEAEAKLTASKLIKKEGALYVFNTENDGDKKLNNYIRIYSKSSGMKEVPLNVLIDNLQELKSYYYGSYTKSEINAATKEAWDYVINNKIPQTLGELELSYINNSLKDEYKNIEVLNKYFMMKDLIRKSEMPKCLIPYNNVKFNFYITKLKVGILADANIEEIPAVNKLQEEAKKETEKPKLEDITNLGVNPDIQVQSVSKFANVVELRNTSDKEVNLKGYMVQYKTDSYTFQEQILKSGEVITLGVDAQVEWKVDFDDNQEIVIKVYNSKGLLIGSFNQ